MILSDDNFSTVGKAVELGRGCVTTSHGTSGTRCAGRLGYVATFLGASLFNLAGGTPLLAVQALWVSFTTLSLQSVGLGYSNRPPG